jgi:tRNA G18 (ribose-2'-O)-methylase SpoU
MTRGWFAIGIEHAKTESNIGTLWRTAFSLGAAYIFTIGHRYKRQSSDTTSAWKHVPLFNYQTLDEMLTARPYDALLVGVELLTTAKPIGSYAHPERAIYLLGAEDHGLSRQAVDACQHVVVLPGRFCHNVAATGAMVMFDRIQKRCEAGGRDD